jgi:ATP-dependent Clp protease ATP-binding subunit ClpB
MLPQDRILVDYESYIAEEDPGFDLIGHDANVRDISHILVQNDGNNVLLFGEPGVGRSAIVKGLTSRKNSPDLPLDILAMRFKRLDVNGLFALGDDDAITEAFNGVMAELQRGPGRVLVVDDFKDFLDNVDNMADSRVLNILMRHLKRGDFQCISLFRKEHLSDVLGCHSDVKELFTKKEVAEPGKDEIVRIAQGKAKDLAKHHDLTIDPAAVEEAVKLTMQYRGVSAFMHAQPSRTLRLLDLTASHVRLKAFSKPAQLEELEAELAKLNASAANIPGGEASPLILSNRAELEASIAELRGEWEGTNGKMRANYQQQRAIEEKLGEIETRMAAEREKISGKEAERKEGVDAVTPKDAPVSEAKTRLQNQFASLLGTASNDKLGAMDESAEMARLRSTKRELTAALDKLTTEFRDMKLSSNQDVTVTAEDVRSKFGELSGIPLTQLSVDEKQRMLNAESFLGKRIKGQDEAIGAIAEALRNAKAGLKDPKKPIGSFFFSGPSGVGKTETTKALAEFLFGDEGAMARLDMSEYMDKSNASRLTGAAPGLVGYEDGGTLTNAVMRRPFSVVLFDEIEKAHPTVLDVMLQILDDGRLTDNKGNVVDFRNTIVVATTNFGAHNFLDEDLPFEDAVAMTEKQLYEKGTSPFRPEFLNRFTGRFYFKPLELPVIHDIAKDQISKINDRVRENGKDFELEISDGELAEFCEARYVKQYGARVVNNAIAKEISSKLAKVILEAEGQGGGGVITVSFSEDGGVAFETKPHPAGHVAPLAAPTAAIA